MIVCQKVKVAVVKPGTSGVKIAVYRAVTCKNLADLRWLRGVKNDVEMYEQVFVVQLEIDLWVRQ